MKHFKRLSRLFLPVFLLCALLVGTAQSALLDVGPTVTQVNPSTEPNLGHGFPLWYRDANRVPLQLCTDRASGMCLTAEPNPLAPLSFPTNIGDELFWWVGDASFDIPVQGALTRAGSAILVQAIEAAYSTGSPVPGAQVSFARIRIRVDTPYAGDYVVTTPFKQFNFTVDAATIADGINFTEDIGIAEGAVFTGALNGSVGPFLYCTNAPIVNAFGSFVGDPNVPCSVLGSTFPSAQNPSNFFRVQGPNGFDMQTNQFSVMGKLYTDPIPTPLTVDKLTYARDASGVQVNAFATTQAMSNQVNGALTFPLNFALTNAASTLQLSGTGIPTQAMTTNNPADGKFFSASGIFALQGNIPANATVTNTADTPVTVKSAPLVDEVKITSATYNPLTSTLTISAQSLDTIANPTLQAFMPGMTDTLGTLSNGQLSVTFPVNDNSGPQPKTFNIPSHTVTVKSSIGGETSAPIVTFVPVISPATMVTPVNASTLTNGSQIFSWTDTGASLYQVWVGTTAGSNNLGMFPAAASTATTTNVTGLPTNGSTVFVRLYSLINGTWQFNDYSYTAFTGIQPATMTTPFNAATLTGASQTFTWSNPGASLYQLWVGTSAGASDIGFFPAAASTATTTNVTGLPTNGSTVFVRLYSLISGSWQFNDYTYTASSISPVLPSTLVTPVNTSTLAGANQTFTWTNTGASLYQLWVGTTVGANNLGFFPAVASSAVTADVTGLPANNSIIFVRLNSLINGVWQFNDYAYISGP